MTQRKSFAEQLSAIRLYVTTPDHEPEPLQTNWSTIAANDNNLEDIEGMKQDKLWTISPSIGEIMKQTTESAPETNAAGQTVKWGSLRFSDGGQTEQGFKLTIDGKVVPHQFVVPAGGLLGSTDKERAQRGGDDNSQDVTSSVAYFCGEKTDFRPAGLFKARCARPMKKTKRKERTGPKTKAEERQWLLDAIENTPVMPKVKRYPDGFPALPSNPAYLFPGMVKVCTGESGSQAWVDIYSAREDRTVFFKWVESLGDKDKQTLEVLGTASNLSEIGGSGHRRTAERRAKRNIIAANDNLMAAINKMAA